MDPRIRESCESIVERWRTLCRFRTVASNLDEMGKASRWLVSQLEPLFSTVGTIPVPGYGPFVYAIEQGASPATVMLYNHYDVQDVGDESLWSSPPFEARMRDGVVTARGACDDKADAAGRLDSFRLWKQEHDGMLPFTVIYVADSCEEAGSPGLSRVLREHKNLLRANACLWESYLREEDGSPVIGYGCRGSLSISITLDLLSSGIHPSYATVVRSAPLEMIAIIASLTTSDGLLAVQGMRGMAVTASAEALERVSNIRVPHDSLSRDNGINPNPSVSANELARRFIFEPGMSLVSFDLDANSARSIPPRCSATVRFNLVPGMGSAACLSLIEKHIHAVNPDARVALVDAIEPAYCSPDSRFGCAIAKAARESYGKDPVIYDVMTGAGPGALFLDYLGAPIAAATGTLRPDGNMHGYNEHGAVEDYLHHIDFTLNVLRQLEYNGFGQT